MFVKAADGKVITLSSLVTIKEVAVAPTLGREDRQRAVAEARLALGWIIVGGLGLATIFTLLLTPVAYRILAPLSQPRAAETQHGIDSAVADQRHLYASMALASCVRLVALNLTEAIS